MMRVVIVLPTFNEAGNIQKQIEEISAVLPKLSTFELHILVVDDYSPDETAAIVRKLARKYANLHLLEGQKQGLGKAYVRGFTYAIRNLRADVVFEMDADLSHPAVLIPKMLDRIVKGADLVIGARYIKGGDIPKDWGLHRKVFSVLGNLIVTLGFMNFRVHDWTSGFRAIKTGFVTEVLSEMGKYNGYVFQIALLDRAIKRNLKIAEVPLKFRDRRKGVSKINTIEYIFNIYSYILQNSAFIKYVIVGLLGFSVDFGFAYLFINQFKLNKPLANSMSAELAIIFNFFMNNFWSFRHKQIKGSIWDYLKKFVLFNLVTSGAILIQYVGMYLALRLFGDTQLYLFNFAIQAWIIYKALIVGLFVIPYSYFMYNKVVWRK